MQRVPVPESTLRIAWVLGAKGFLGRYVARHLHSEGWVVRGLGRGDWVESGDWGLEDWQASSVSAEALESLAASGIPDAVFCAAGSGTVAESFSDADTAHDDTVGSARITLDFLGKNALDAVFVYPSSCAVYGSRDEEPIAEDSPRRPASPYGAYKLEVERLCGEANQEHGLRCGVIRFFSLYGPGLRKQLIWDLAARAQGEGPILLSGTGCETRDLLHVGDAAALTATVISTLTETELDDVLTVNGGTGRALTVERIARLVLGQLPTNAEIVFSGTPREGDPPHFRADMSRSSLLGFTPRWKPEKGIADYCRWIKGELWGVWE